MTANQRSRIGPGHSSESWTREQAFIYTGVFVGGQGHWQADRRGGSDVKRRLKLYAADKGHRPYEETLCQKRQDAQDVGLVPGLYLLHCASCRLCIGLQLMITPESPAVPFELLYSRFDRLPDVFVADNACHVVRFCLRADRSLTSARLTLPLSSYCRPCTRACESKKLSATSSS